LAERRPDILQRFRSLTVPGPDGCQLWTGYAPDGVPRFFFNGPQSARHVALLLVGRHRTKRVRRIVSSCGSRLCVAVDHLVEVPPGPAIRRRKKKVLPPEIVRQIVDLRRRGAKLTEVAALFHVAASTVCRLAGPQHDKKTKEVA
jgi:hypothetical protein